MPLRRRSVVAAVALAAALGAALPSSAVHGPGEQILVKTEPGRRATSLLRGAGAQPIRTLEGLPGWVVARLPAGVSAATLRRRPGILSAEPIYQVQAAAEPNDPCLPRACPTVPQWNMYEIAAPLAWEAYPGRTISAVEKLASDPIIVAVIDTQIDTDHPDFVNDGGTSADLENGGQLYLSAMRSWVAPGADAGPSAYHGTYVAGILGAATGNGLDVAGMGANAAILPLAVLDGNGKTDTVALAEAIVYAHRAGARIINLSLGTTSDAAVVRDAIRQVTSGPDAALVVAAAGNNTKDLPFYPGSYPEVMSVSGFDSTLRLAGCSNYNDNISVSAPARHVPSLAPMPERQRVVDCGTSAAAPHVAGLASLLLGQDPTRTPAELRAIIERTADDDAQTPGRDARFGYGRINADRALREGIGPVVSDIAATLASRGNRTSTVEAIATSSLPITAAEAYIGRPGHAPARMTLTPKDGAWGQTLERVTGSIEFPEGQTSQELTVFVRAADSRWGPAARGRAVIDRSLPEIVNIRSPHTIRGGQSTTSFVLRDAYSSRFRLSAYAIDPAGTVVWRWPSVRLSAGPHSLVWTPPLTVLPGPYAIEINVWDEAGNPGFATVQTLIV